MDPTDHELLQAAIGGDASAFAELVRRSLPAGAYGNLPDVEFVEPCLGAVSGLATPLPSQEFTGDGGLLQPQPSEATIRKVAPPVFDLADGITFEEPHTVPPIAIEPPPICEPVSEPNSQAWLLRRRPHLVLTMTLLVSLAVGSGWLFGLGGSWFDLVFAASDRDQQVASEVADSIVNKDPSGDNSSIAKSIDGGHINGEPQVGVDDGSPAHMDVPGPIMAAKRGPQDFPRVIRGSVEEESPIIQDNPPLPTGPLLIKISNGNLMYGRDAQWAEEPGAWMVPREPDASEAGNDARLVRLTHGEARLVLDNGLSVGMEAPAAFRFVSSNRLSLIEGHFLIESKEPAAPIDFTVETDSFEMAIQNAAAFFVNSSPEFGTGIEMLHGEARLTPQSGLGQAETVSKDGFYAGHFLPTKAAADSKPRAAALMQRDGNFIGQIMAFQTPLQISSVEVFGATLQTVVKRMREAPADFDRDWSDVVSRLEKLKATNRKRPGLQHEINFAGDLLPAFPELQAKLGRGIRANGLFDGGLIRHFAGQLNINGQLVNLDNLEELTRIQQELADELSQLQDQRKQMRGNRNRRNPVDPDFTQQVLIQQILQIEMILGMAQGVPVGAGVIPQNGAGPFMAPEPVVAMFTGLGTPAGAQDREAIIASLKKRLAGAFGSGE